MKVPLASHSIAILVLARFNVECLKISGEVSRRRAFVSVVNTCGTIGLSQPSGASDTESTTLLDYHDRDRYMNKNVLIREDYWYMTGKTPPRLLSGPLKGDDPAFNAFGSCASEVKGENSCTYVSLKQRIPAYTKYGNSIAYGAKEMSQLGRVLEQLEAQPTNEELWQRATEFVALQDRMAPPPLVDAELKMILLATALMISPAFPSPSRELLVARFYANEAHFASSTLVKAMREKNSQQARAAWEFGRDSWNSYFQVVNRSISPKVGDKFEAIA
ncbi:hypothetical protein MPSEU_000612000 [Mayamaea pseudoterrestris]|nr:hypothetical protein MPSEU_000612000 [Mayamaea pseudoterrestris]